jgi:hypothetical protein
VGWPDFAVLWNSIIVAWGRLPYEERRNDDDRWTRYARHPKHEFPSRFQIASRKNDIKLTHDPAFVKGFTS